MRHRFSILFVIPASPSPYVSVIVLLKYSAGSFGCVFFHVGVFPGSFLEQIKREDLFHVFLKGTSCSFFMVLKLGGRPLLLHHVKGMSQLQRRYQHFSPS